MKENLINRKTYKAVKKMDRQDMENFLATIYSEGFKDGTESAEMTDFKIQLVEILHKAKGVGPKTFDNIMETMKEMGI